MSKKITMDYDEYLRLLKYKEALEKKDGILYISNHWGYFELNVIDIPSAINEVIKNTFNIMSIKEFKAYKKSLSNEEKK